MSPPRQKSDSRFIPWWPCGAGPATSLAFRDKNVVHLQLVTKQAHPSAGESWLVLAKAAFEAANLVTKRPGMEAADR
jgi:hypothetical protein